MCVYESVCVRVCSMGADGVGGCSFHCVQLYGCVNVEGCKGRLGVFSPSLSWCAWHTWWGG